MKKTLYIFFVIVTFISLSGCQKSDFYNKDFTGMFGNTSENVCQGGLMASTDEYIYLPLKDVVIEISRKTGESVVLQNIDPEFGYINVVDGYLFYNASSSEKNRRGLVVQSLDGKFFRQISKKSYYPFIVFEEWIYATNLRGGNLYKINIKNSKITMLAEEPVEEFTLHDNGIFYNNGKELYSISLDGKNKQRLLSDVKLKSLIYIKKDNTLIFINSSRKNKICSYNINTKELSYIKNGEYKLIQMFGDDEIVALDSTGLMQSFSLLDGHVDMEISGVTNFQIFDQTLYYFDESKSVYCITGKNQKPTIVYSSEGEISN